jgi:hypothetical protein
LALRRTAAIAGQKGSAVLFLNAVSTAAIQLRDRAQQLVAGSDTDRQIAVILAQCACELITECAFIDLIRYERVEHQGPLLLAGMPRTYSLTGKRARKLYTALTQDRPAGDDHGRNAAPWWRDWRRSCTLRHRVAHKGAPVTPEEATRAVDSAAAYMAHVERVVLAARDKPR